MAWDRRIESISCTDSTTHHHLTHEHPFATVDEDAPRFEATPNDIYTDVCWDIIPVKFQ